MLRTKKKKESLYIVRHYIYMSVNQNGKEMNEMALNQE